MAGGPLFPISAFPVSSNAFPGFHVGAGANSKQDEGLRVAASIAADTIWRLRFAMPPTSLPSGTGKLLLWALANATSGAAKVNPKGVMVAAGSDPSSATLTAVGTNTLTWAAGDNDDYKELKITLTGITLAADQMLVMDLTFETASWTLAQVSTWIPRIIWE